MAYEIMDDSVYWGIFGAVVSGIITHSIMEIIYNQDFKKIFAKKIEMGISIATALALISVFQFDILGYDRYIPKLGNVKRVAVVSDLLESNRGQYCNKMKIWGNEDAPDYADIDYSNYSDDILNLCNTMDIEDKEAVLELAKLCVSGDNSGDAPEQVLISYKLKSGKSVQRVYYMDCETIAAQLAKIYNDESFKKSMYPILTDDGSKIVSVDYNGIENDDKHIDLSDKALRQEFIETYKKELLNFKYENRLTSRPFASIRFNNEYMQRALNIYMRDKGLSGVSIDTTYPQAMRDVGYYPIYPEFTETIRLLKKCGADVIEKIPVEDVDRIEIIYNEKLPIEDIEGGYSYRAETDVFTDAEDIEKILDKLVLCDSPYKDSLNEEIEIGAQIFLKEDKESPFEVGDLHDYSGGYYTNNFHFRRGDLPDNLKYILDKMK